MFFVYKIVGPTGSYVGKAVNVTLRWNAHRRKARELDRRPLYRAINKYGLPCFFTDVLVCCDTEDGAFECERQIIQQELKAGTRLYNLTSGGRSGCVHTAETKAKIAAASLGRKHPPETIERMRRAQSGKRLSAECRRKIGEAKRGNKYWVGKHHTEETKRKISAVLKAKGLMPPLAHRKREQDLINLAA